LISTKEAGPVVSAALDREPLLPNTLASVAPTAQTAETPPRNVLLEITDIPSLEIEDLVTEEGA
jgi:hypothetical protein